jgi:two-component system, LytTR family, response regulator
LKRGCSLNWAALFLLNWCINFLLIVKIATMIVDDEAPHRKLLRSLIDSYCSYLQVIEEADSVASAEKMIAKHQPKVLFLDIEMPTQKGFELLNKFPDRKFLAIMTTGHDQYGIKAVKAGAFEYLLKPIDADELMEVEQKIVKELGRTATSSNEVIKVFDQGEQIVIKISEIVFLKAQGSYTLINLAADKEILTAKNLNLMMSDFRTTRLVRVHRSYVVNLDYVKSYQPSGNEGILTLQGGLQLRVSRTYKALLKSLLL